jgi:hypothetical protein
LAHPKTLADTKTLAPTEMLEHRKNLAPANVGAAAAGKVGGSAEELPYC